MCTLPRSQTKAVQLPATICQHGCRAARLRGQVSTFKQQQAPLADHSDGPFGKPSEPFTGDWVEGPSAIKIKDEYLVHFDHYAQPHYYGAVRSRDLEHWEDCSKEMSFPKDHRHGTVLRVPHKIVQRLLAIQ